MEGGHLIALGLMSGLTGENRLQTFALVAQGRRAGNEKNINSQQFA
jgi:hypothetical protein